MTKSETIFAICRGWAWGLVVGALLWAIWFAFLRAQPPQSLQATWIDSRGEQQAVVTIQELGESLEAFVARHAAAVRAAE